MALTKTSKNGYDIYTETGLTLADNAGDNIEYVTVTSAFPDGINWEDVKFAVNCQMTTATTDATTGVDMVLQTSVNGTTTDDVIGTASSATPSWVDSVAIDTNIATGVLAHYSAECDASSIRAPYARLAIKSVADDLNGAAGRATVSFAVKGTNISLQGNEIGGDGTTGIGSDPS